MKAETGDVIDHGPEELGLVFKHVVKSSDNPRGNADSWKALMALTQREKIRKENLRKDAEIRNALKQFGPLASYNVRQQETERVQRAMQKAQVKSGNQKEAVCSYIQARGLTEEHPAYHRLAKRCASAKAKKAGKVTKSTSALTTRSSTRKGNQKATKGNQKSSVTSKSSLRAKTSKSSGKPRSSIKAAKGKSGVTKKVSLSAPRKAMPPGRARHSPRAQGLEHLPKARRLISNVRRERLYPLKRRQFARARVLPRVVLRNPKER
ncbi:hypothetical protein CPB86DRAFT_186501 [Serendipita vermifera]|nr:hypothetical protein CPB86DRAFT_186501 [Serendipita vermifera]